MAQLAYLFERFPSFGQTFCYREVAEVIRQGVDVQIFSIRRPADEPPQDWDPEIVRRVLYLPDEKALVTEIDGANHRGKLPGAVAKGLTDWGRQTDFLRLYQAAFVGLRLDRGVRWLHAHFAGMAARTAWWVRRFFELPFSFTAHANDVFAPRAFAVGIDKLMSDAAAVVTVSDYSAQLLREKFPAAAARIHRVYNGIQLAQFRRTNALADPPKIISVGRLIEKKGFADLVGACEILAKRGRNFRCDIIGDGPLGSQLRGQIAAAKVSELVNLRGALPQHEIIEELASSTLFALACTTEPDGGMDNLPTVIMEAMAAGLPVVSTDLAGVPEMMAEDETGLLVRPGDRPGLADAIERIAFDPALARQLGSAGYSRAGSKFAIESTTRQLIELIAR